jgi:transcriptional regulator NrdR family protein
MQVIKRSGNAEPYDKLKVQTSIKNAAGSLDINESDAKVLEREIAACFEGRTAVYSRQIHYATIGVLYTFGFSEAAQSYMGHASSAWRKL